MYPYLTRIFFSKLFPGKPIEKSAMSHLISRGQIYFLVMVERRYVNSMRRNKNEKLKTERHV